MLLCCLKKTTSLWLRVAVCFLSGILAPVDETAEKLSSLLEKWFSGGQKICHFHPVVSWVNLFPAAFSIRYMSVWVYRHGARAGRSIRGSFGM